MQTAARELEGEVFENVLVMDAVGYGPGRAGHQETFWLLNRLSEPWNTTLGSLKARLGSLRTLRLAKTVRGFLMGIDVVDLTWILGRKLTEALSCMTLNCEHPLAAT